MEVGRAGKGAERLLPSAQASGDLDSLNFFGCEYEQYVVFYTDVLLR